MGGVRWVVAGAKGGSGKTTLAVSVAGVLAEGSTRDRAGLGRRVLVVDLDPQAAATAALGATCPAGGGVYSVLVSGADASGAVVASRTPGIDVLPASAALAGAALELPRRDGWQVRLRDVLDGLGGAWDDVVIDTPPGLGVLSMVGLVAARWALVPTPPEWASVRLVDETLATVERARSIAGSDLAVLGVVAWRVGRRTLHRDEALGALSARWSQLLLDGAIPERVAYAEASLDGLPVTAYLPASPAAAAVRDLTKEILTRASSS
ncbi:MAG: ParA family protein [Actinomycetota bacterium]|nr:ParA family protein [Actinomycetota bacterium]